jgi:protein-L-isoaspartate(D-aspartate) O-methyltransferase
MIERQLRSRGISSPTVLHAFSTIPRHLFVDKRDIEQAYEDRPLPISCNQTISQPYMVAWMTELLSLQPEDRVLEIGTGSGYQTAILAVLAEEIYTIERHRLLLDEAIDRLEILSLPNVKPSCRDGSSGWKEKAPFNAILAAAGAPVTPQPLLDQLAVGGRLVLPVGTADHQILKRYIRTENGIEEEDHGGCRFVKFIGDFAWPEE